MAEQEAVQEAVEEAVEEAVKDEVQEAVEEEVLLSPNTNRPINPDKEPSVVFWCDTCARKLDHVRGAVMHLEGKPHKKNLLNSLKRPLSKEDENLHPAAKKSNTTSTAEALTTAVTSATESSVEKTTVSITCDDCNIEFKHHGNAIDHFKGKKHVAAVALKALKKRGVHQQPDGRFGRGGANDRGQIGGRYMRGRGGAGERGRGGGFSRGRGEKSWFQWTRDYNAGSYGRGTANSSSQRGGQQAGRGGMPGQAWRGGPRGRGTRGGINRNSNGGVPVGGQFSNYQPEVDPNNSNFAPLGAPSGGPPGRMDDTNKLLEQVKSQNMNRRELISALLVEEEKELMAITNKVSAGDYTNKRPAANGFDHYQY